MTIRVALDHYTEYRYARPVALTPHVIRLRPAPHSRTPIHAYSLSVEPAQHFINWQQDPFGNFLARLVFPEKTRRFSIRVDLVADMTVINPFDFFVEESAERFPFDYEPQLRKDLAPYLAVDEDGPRLREWVAAVERSPRPIVEFLVSLNQRLERDIEYLIRMEPGVQSCEDTLGLARGSCRDSGWLLVQALRHLGLAARFVSGYLVQLAPDVEALDGPSGPREDFTDLHAWAEVYIPGAGWVGLDPTSGLFAGEGHIPLACTPHPMSAAPVTGATEDVETEFTFHNQVKRIHEDPRVTRPYSEPQWAAIDRLGEAVDAQLQAGDVRLTMGGEPTFVSIDDMEGAEWNTAALGDDKRRLAGRLFERLRECFAPGSIPHYAQGKWYPGEPLPRWALSCYWRADGHPLWQQPALLAADDHRPPADLDRAKAFAVTLVKQLGLAEAYLIEAFEDARYYRRLAEQLPVNLDTDAAEALPEPEQQRLAQLLERGLDRPAGFVLPLGWEDDEGWRSSAWPLREDRLELIPGDSPLGLRLPLERLPWLPPEARPLTAQRDPFEPREPLGTAPSAGGREAVSAAAPPEPESELLHVLHTALSVESRDGLMCVFMPPLTHLEHWLALLQAIEQSAQALGQAVRLEGYPPPVDQRLRHFSITPDPGVIEVNVQPAASWSELVATTRTLYEEARLARLGTEKFMLDGRHSGTGGGNHVTLGGPAPADSPLVRRPHLLRSLITYWQQHPALSYLFSGSFIGPTSQAPRVDEARDDNLYELEIAFAQLPQGDCEQPWLIDRVLRNLLVDLTGNTHRAEFCIDKLYPPHSALARRGLLEFRAFEMPPHWQMSALQMVLLRALVARFWTSPHRPRLIRWGTALHDRFMLPHFVAADLHDVVDDLRDAGFAFEQVWFAPFVEFRFPVFGRVSVAGMELELRWALEPWNVLGEEISAQGTARYVDSSVERLQVRVGGLIEDRFVVTCNGRRVPLQPTGREGEYVAGVRYKAWQPPSGLHPTIKVHVPLRFDLVDTRNRRSLGGCTYHVAHPGGRNYDTFPVNAFEAEARRIARFWDHGHTAGTIEVPAEEPAYEHPFTLDLRRPAGVTQSR